MELEQSLQIITDYGAADHQQGSVILAALEATADHRFQLDVDSLNNKDGLMELERLEAVDVMHNIQEAVITITT